MKQPDPRGVIPGQSVFIERKVACGKPYHTVWLVDSSKWLGYLVKDLKREKLNNWIRTSGEETHAFIEVNTEHEIFVSILPPTRGHQPQGTETSHSQKDFAS